MISTPTPNDKKAGLAYWAQRVLEECDKASQGFAADPVHDLRVAIRRCRSMADGFLSVDPDPGWKQMKRLGKPLFAGDDGVGGQVVESGRPRAADPAARIASPRNRIEGCGPTRAGEVRP